MSKEEDITRLIVQELIGAGKPFTGRQLREEIQKRGGSIKVEPGTDVFEWLGVLYSYKALEIEGDDTYIPQKLPRPVPPLQPG
jgi:hypothetical protein